MSLTNHAMIMRMFVQSLLLSFSYSASTCAEFHLWPCIFAQVLLLPHGVIMSLSMCVTWCCLICYCSAVISICTKPTLNLTSVQITYTGSMRPFVLNTTSFIYDQSIGSSAIYLIVPAASNATLFFKGSDNPISKNLTIRHRGEPGIPAVGCLWSAQMPQPCSVPNIVCREVVRNFTFAAPLIYAGQNISICFEAVNDQTQCPYYQRNSAFQPYGVYSGIGINGSQASESICVLFRIPAPVVSWIYTTPAESAQLVTYAGCPFSIELSAQDEQGTFDVAILPVIEQPSRSKPRTPRLTCARRFRTCL